MRFLPSSRKAGAFTLIEMLCVIAIIGILAALLLPALNQGQGRARRVQCLNNLKETGIAFHAFAHDHNGHFPMDLPGREGGSQEFVQNGYLVSGEFYFSFRHFQPLSNDLVTPKLLHCPADITRSPAQKFGSFINDNLSYFVGVTADFARPGSVLTGDRNVTNTPWRSPTILRSSPANPVRWTEELHRFKGNLLFSDAHVEEANSVELASSANQAVLIADLFVPSVRVGSMPTMTANPTPPSRASSPARNNRPVVTHSPAGSPGRGGSTALMVQAQESVSVEVSVTTNTVTAEANVAAVTNQPTPAKPEAREAETDGRWTGERRASFIYSLALPLFLVLLILLAALLAVQLRRRARRVERLRSAGP